MKKSKEEKILSRWQKENDRGAKPPINKENLEELFNYVSETTEHCDNTLLHTENFLDSKKLDKKKIIKWLNSKGGYCDCEVLMNVPEP
jgi:hypothetical protein